MKKLCLYMVLCALATGAHADEKHPTIHHAIATLEQTKTELENGEHGFGGHRAKAIEHIDLALKELHEALSYSEIHPDEVKAPGAIMTPPDRQ